MCVDQSIAEISDPCYFLEEPHSVFYILDEKVDVVVKVEVGVDNDAEQSGRFAGEFDFALIIDHHPGFPP